ncbi:hypothetical protein [Azospirillum sp.]|uniref:hypothetical protein n=1 Tax=Azospirillum sp. TaxID=34012 RepID=UPI002D3A589A|nr:hypothetical protein [Azospirillum sp.]HYD70745.1 hypothetical protein [Azospirillum sp.]
MMHRLTLALLLFVLPGCADDAPPTDASGPLRALNPGRWTPGADDLRTPLAPAAAPSMRTEAGR